MSNNPALIKWLYSRGFCNKTICLITGAKQPYVTKVIQGKVRRNEAPSLIMDSDETTRYKLITQLIGMSPIMDNTEQMIIHMKLLKKIGLVKNIIYEVYGFLSKRTFEYVYSQEVDINKFDAERYLGINMQDFIQKVFGA